MTMNTASERWLELPEARRKDGPGAVPETRLFRHSPKDAYLVGALLLQTLATGACAVFVAPGGPAGAACLALSFGCGVCWCSNTISHNHLHNPLFVSRSLNRGLSLWLTLATGVPQSLWRRRHFWHHAGEARPFRFRLTPSLRTEGLLLIAFAAALFAALEAYAFVALGLGYLFGMGLCTLQGRMEHRGVPRNEAGVSFYGRVYNALCFNDGYHAEHHRFPLEHWSHLPERRLSPSGDFPGSSPDGTVSAWPPLLRGIEARPSEGSEALGRRVPRLLCALERGVLRSFALQAWVLSVHRQALAELVKALPFAPARVVIVGGGLFPRSFLALASLLPRSRFVIVDQCASHIEGARAYLERARIDVASLEFRTGTFDGRDVTADDLVVVPLAYEGRRSALDALRGQAAMITHDWLWRSSSISRRVSVLLLKRVNLYPAVLPRVGLGYR
jgi:hypothetical protein